MVRWHWEECDLGDCGRHPSPPHTTEPVGVTFRLAQWGELQQFGKEPSSLDNGVERSRKALSLLKVLWSPWGLMCHNRCRNVALFGKMPALCIA